MGDQFSSPSEEATTRAGDFHKRSYKTTATKLWVAVFAYAASVAMFVQLVLLPHFFPSWHAGDGLLVGGDWIYFHRLATDMSQQIRNSGWSEWALRPEGQAPAGIAAAMYALTLPKPWTLIPISAALFATATVVLFSIVLLFLPDWKRAALCSLPFAIYPSAMLWYAQIHKDVYAGTGVLLFLYGLLTITHLNTSRWSWRRLAAGVSCLAAGTILVWVVRPYEVQMMQLITMALLLPVAAVHLHRALRRRLLLQRVILPMIVICATSAVMGAFAAEPRLHGIQATHEATGPLSPLVRVTSFVESKVDTLARLRALFVSSHPDSASLIDVDAEFGTIMDVVRYLPRAIEIALLAPFPSEWFEAGSLEANSLMRRISALEMIGVYLALPFALGALIRWHRRIEMWIIWIYCLGMMLTYTVATPNVGTLYRVRYAFLMTLVAIGLAAFFAQRTDSKRNLSCPPHATSGIRKSIKDTK